MIHDHEFTAFISPLVRIALICAAIVFTPEICPSDEPAGTIGYWPLIGDDRFNGRDRRVEVIERSSWPSGTGEFSIALWVHTDQKLDDVLGDLVSKYDPATRHGFNLSIQNFAGVTSSQSNHRHLHFGIDDGSPLGDWIDHGRLGDAILIFAMAVHDGQLFAGTCEAGRQQSGRVFRYDGKIWTDCGSPDRCNSVASLAVHDGKLYVGTAKYRLAGSSLTESQNPYHGGSVYRYEGDGRWAHCGKLPNTEAINGMVVYRGDLYAGSMYAPAGFYRYQGDTAWVSCGTPNGKRVESLTVFNGEIYATGYDEGAVYRYDGNNWESMGVLPGANQTYGFATHRGRLYVSEWPHARVFRLEGKQQWRATGRLGDEQETMPLMVYNGKLYGGTLPSAKVYRYEEPNWQQVGRLDQTPDVRYRRVWSMAVYQGRLFAGVLPSGHVHSIEVGRNVTYDHALPSGWVHLVAVRERHRLRLFVDGQQVAVSKRYPTEPYDISNSTPLTIGFGQHDYFNGRLRDVTIVDHALTSEQIQQLAVKRRSLAPETD